MVRTQIYLTEEERRGLDNMSRVTGRKQSELIREAVDRLLDLAEGSQRDAVLQEAAGLWRDRKDLPDFAAVRRSWNRW
jgi:Arc/MetJ-type ribon-helix-helix transcriptional regulator